MEEIVPNAPILLPHGEEDVESVNGEVHGTLSLSMAVRALTRFDGQGMVEEWIYSTGDLMDCLREEDQTLFFRVLRTYVIGEASMAIRGQDESWESARNALFEIYGDKKTITEVERLLTAAKQGKTESVDVYASRLRRLGIRYLALLQRKYGLDAVYRRMTNDRTRDYFIRGLKFSLYQVMVNGTYRDLSEAQSTASNLEKEFAARADMEPKSGPPHGLEPYRCFTCNQPGHTSQTCRQRGANRERAPNQRVSSAEIERDGPSAGPAPNLVCQFCQGRGHTAKECRQLSTGGQTCQWCDRPGHSADKCNRLKSGLDQGKQGSPWKPKLLCQFCGKGGHTIDQCYTLQNQRRSEGQQTSGNGPRPTVNGRTVGQ